MESLFLPIDLENNRVLNVDTVTNRRRIEFIQGESYNVSLRFLSGTGAVTPDIANFSFVIRESASASTDLIAVTGLNSQTGSYPYYFTFTGSSPALNTLLDDVADYADYSAQMVWTETGGAVEIIAPITARFTAANTGVAAAYVASVNSLDGEISLTGAGSVTVSANGQVITISGESVNGDYATTANLAATGSNLQTQINSLNGQTGNYYLASNPSGFITGVDLSPYATTVNLAATGGNLQGQINTLTAQTGNYLTAIPADVVRTTGIQSITGVKSFQSQLRVTGGLHVTAGGNTVIDASSHTLFSNGQTSVNWSSKFLQDDSGIAALYWGVRELRNTSNLTVLNWNGRQAYDSASVAVLDWGNKILSDESGVALNWDTRTLSGDWLTNTTPTASEHLINKGYFDARTGVLTETFVLRTETGSFAIPADVVRTTGNQSITGIKTFLEIVSGTDFSAASFFASFSISTDLLFFNQAVPVGGGAMIDLTNARLQNTDEVATLDWQQNILSGNWQAETPISGNHVANKTYVDGSVGSAIANVVRTTGQQTIAGEKTFFDTVHASGILAEWVRDNDGQQAIYLRSGHLVDSAGVVSTNWSQRVLKDDGGIGVLNWQTKFLSGGWNIPAPTITNSAETQQTLTCATGVSWNLDNGGAAKLTVTGNPTVLNPSNTRNGATYILEIIQGTGNSAVSWGSNFVWAGGTAPTITTTSGKRDIVTFYCSNSKLYGTAVQNFA